MSTTDHQTNGGLAAGKVRRTLHNPVGPWVMTEANGTVHECTDLVTLLQRMTEQYEKGSTEKFTFSKGWGEEALASVIGREVARTDGDFYDTLVLARKLVPLSDEGALDVERIVIGYSGDDWAFHYAFADGTTVGIESAGRGMSHLVRRLVQFQGP